MYKRTELLVELKREGENPPIYPVFTSNSELVFQTLPSSGIQPSVLPAIPQEVISKKRAQHLTSFFLGPDSM